MTIFAGLDTETTGLDIGDHRIIEIHIGLYEDDNPKAFDTFTQRIDPERSIAADAERVHGISLADLHGKPKWAEVAPDIVKFLERADCFVAHNAEFDMNFLQYETKRIKLRMPERPVIDTMKEAPWATPDGKVPSLADLCFSCGVSYDPSAAHAADYDVDVMMQSFFNARRLGFFQLPEGETVDIAA